MRKNDFDTKLIVYRARQIFVLVCTAILTAVFTLILMRHGESGFPWYALIIPMSGLGLLLVPIPPTEHWEYKPWQGKPRRIEQQER